MDNGHDTRCWHCLECGYDDPGAATIEAYWIEADGTYDDEHIYRICEFCYDVGCPDGPGYAKPDDLP